MMGLRTHIHNALVGLKLTDWIIATFTVVLAVVAFFQMRDTHTLATQAVIQSNAALTQANISQRSFDAIFHPTVEVSSITYNQADVADDGVISYTLKNVGSAPAERLRVHVKATFGVRTRDVSPRNVPSEFGVGAGFADAPKVTYGGKETGEALDGRTQLKVRFSIQYAAHDRPLVLQCSSFVLEPMKREMYPIADANAPCGLQ